MYLSDSLSDLFFATLVMYTIVYLVRECEKMTHIVKLKTNEFVRMCYNTCVAVLVTYGCNFNVAFKRMRLSKCRVFLC